MTESNSSPESMLAAFDRHRPILLSIEKLGGVPPLDRAEIVEGSR